MANTYTLISSVTVGSGGAADITLSSIPSTYTDLVLLISSRSTQTGTAPDGLGFQLNSDTGANYNQRQLYGDGSVTGSTSNTGLTFGYVGPVNGASSTANVFTSSTLYIPNYTSSNYKTISVDSVTENNTTGANAGLRVNIWNSTSAITSIKLFDFVTGNLVQYSTAYLYGISNA
jgi:hypothetical protein